MTGNGQPREPALCQLYRHTFVPYSGSSVSECSSFMLAWEWREDETTVVCWLEVLKICSHELNWSELNSSVNSRIGIHAFRTRRAPSVLVSLSWRWPMNASCNSVDLLQVSSVGSLWTDLNKAVVMLLNCCLTAGTVGVRVRRDIHARSDHEGGRLRTWLSVGRWSLTGSSFTPAHTFATAGTSWTLSSSSWGQSRRSHWNKINVKRMLLLAFISFHSVLLHCRRADALK